MNGKGANGAKVGPLVAAGMGDGEGVGDAELLAFGEDFHLGKIARGVPVLNSPYICHTKEKEGEDTLVQVMVGLGKPSTSQGMTRVWFSMTDRSPPSPTIVGGTTKGAVQGPARGRDRVLTEDEELVVLGGGAGGVLGDAGVAALVLPSGRFDVKIAPAREDLSESR